MSKIRKDDTPSSASYENQKKFLKKSSSAVKVSPNVKFGKQPKITKADDDFTASKKVPGVGKYNLEKADNVIVKSSNKCFIYNLIIKIGVYKFNIIK